MPLKREITIHLVTTSQQSRVSSIVNAIAELADDLTVTCKVLGRTTERPRKKKIEGGRTNSPDPVDNDELKSDAQLAYTCDQEAPHKRYIDVETSLKKLNLTREQLMSRTWARGTPQYRLKRAAKHKRHAIALAGVSNGASAARRAEG
jgi:hypothetical protein